MRILIIETLKQKKKSSVKIFSQQKEIEEFKDLENENCLKKGLLKKSKSYKQIPNATAASINDIN